MRFKIADIVFDCSSYQPTDSLRLEASSEDFLSTEVPDVCIKGHYSENPEILFKDEDKMFESGILWDVYRINGLPTFVIKINPDSQKPYCFARFSTDFRYGNFFYLNNNNEISDGRLPHPLAFPIFHLLMISLLSKGYGILIHACGIDDHGKGLLFAGSSTHGKTTIARLWENQAVILNDERVVLRQHKGLFWIYGTPWHGEYERVSPCGVPLKKIFFLQKADANSAGRLNGAIATSNLLLHCFLPYWETDGMNFTLEFCANVTAEIPCYELGFVRDNSVVDFVRCVK